MADKHTDRHWLGDKDCRDSFAQYHRQHLEFHQRMARHRELHARTHRHHDALHQYRYFRYLRPLMMLFNLLVLYLLYRLLGIKAISIFIGAVIIFAATMQFIFFQRIERRILAPVRKLIKGVEEISMGNYCVEVKEDIPNDIGSLINSFNEMARKLRESERLKLEYEDNRKTLIANISHDLKTPITSMQGYLEALLEGVITPDKVEQYLQIIYNNTLYTNKLIDDLFLFTKLDMQKLDFIYTDVTLRPFMRDLFQEFQLELAERHVQFQYTDTLPQDALIYLDGKRIHQALTNIIGNAVKHGPEQGLSIDVKLYQQEAADKIYINISDNGPGISPDKLPYIFERFYRIDNERTKDLLSTGLGLAIAKELIQAHNGDITVSSVEDEGTCFTIMLPVKNVLS